MSRLPGMTSSISFLLGLLLVREMRSLYHEDMLVDPNNDIYPSSIVSFRVRRDFYTSEPVTRGRLQRLANLTTPLEGYDSLPKVSLEEFKRLLQCSPRQPALHDKLSSLLPPTRETVQLVATFLESECARWTQCRYVAPRFRMGLHAPSLTNRLVKGPIDPGAMLLRVMNGRLWWDWPWGRRRFPPPDPAHVTLFLYTLSLIRDIPDSVFLLAEETSALPWDVPFPSFTSSPRIDTGDMPSIWPRSFANELNVYRSFLKGGEELNNYDSFYTKQRPWRERFPKAVFYGNLGRIRQVLFDLAVMRPDLIEARWTYNWGMYEMKAWNPLSSERPLSQKKLQSDPSYPGELPSLPINISSVGYLQNILHLRIPRSFSSEMGNFKYVVVLLGLQEGLAAADRLAEILAHSGAVILLQESRFQYHFSHFLQPWVHYVPIAYSLVDLLRKIEWLKRNDKLARRLAANAKAFGLSYLRIEDYFCYAASALEYVGRLENGTDATEAFDVMAVPYRLMV